MARNFFSSYRKRCMSLVEISPSMVSYFSLTQRYNAYRSYISEIPRPFGSEWQILQLRLRMTESLLQHVAHGILQPCGLQDDEQKLSWSKVLGEISASTLKITVSKDSDNFISPTTHSFFHSGTSDEPQDKSQNPDISISGRLFSLSFQRKKVICSIVIPECAKQISWIHSCSFW